MSSHGKMAPFTLNQESFPAHPRLHKWATNHGFGNGGSIYKQGNTFYEVMNGRFVAVHLPPADPVDIPKEPDEPPAKKKKNSPWRDPKTGRTKERQKDIDKGFKKGGEGVGKAAKKLMMNSEFKKTAMKMAETALADSMVDGSMAEEALNASREIIEKYYKKAFKAIDKAIAEHKAKSEDGTYIEKDVMKQLGGVFEAITKTTNKAMKDIQQEIVGQSIQRLLDVEKAFPGAYKRLNPGPKEVPADAHTQLESISNSVIKPKKKHEPVEEPAVPPPFNPDFKVDGFDNVIDAVNSDGEDEKISTSKKV